MPRRPCITEGCPNLARPNGPRCDSCETAHQRARNANRPQYHGDWPRLARAAIADHRATHGDICPGWHTPPHPITPDQWTCDHHHGPLCRSCNSRKGATVDKQRAQADRNAR